MSASDDNALSASNDEILTAEISFEPASDRSAGNNAAEKEAAINARLKQLNSELDKYTNHADKLDYAAAVASGLIAGLIDSFYVGKFSIEESGKWGRDKIEQFVVSVARKNGYNGGDANEAFKFLNDRERGDRIAFSGDAQQNGSSVLSSHGSIVGLLFSLLTQFTGKSCCTDDSGAFKIVDAGESAFIGQGSSQKMLFGVVSWFLHLAGSFSGSDGVDQQGGGIPGWILYMAKELASSPLFKHNDKNRYKEISELLSREFKEMFFKGKEDEGSPLPVVKDLKAGSVGLNAAAKAQSLPVLINEMCVRAFFFIRRFCDQIKNKNICSAADLGRLDWSELRPSDDRTLNRMITVSSLTFTAADAADAAIRAAVESAGNWAVFAVKFASRINYVGALRAVVAVCKELSDEEEEMQRIRERRLLMEEKTELVFQRIQEFKNALEERLSDYLAEDIGAFLESFEFIDEGLGNGNSDLVIRGNVRIQTILGKEVQFSSQKEFDEIMECDVPLKL